jgi:hypothetical protein
MLNVFAVFSQIENQRAAVIRIEGSGQVARTDIDMPVNQGQVITVPEGFSYSTTNGGIFLILPKAGNNVKLFSLTGQMIWNGELVSGRFYIPTGKGIYILRVNNKSYKVNCK